MSSQSQILVQETEIKSKRRLNQPDYSFQGHPLVQGRHRIHSYPAMLHPLLVESLLDRFADRSSKLLDPFCGSGTSLLCAATQSISAVGYDINPLALVIARAKTTHYDFDHLQSEKKLLGECLSDTQSGDIPEIENIDYWYHQEAIDHLARIRKALLLVPLRYLDFFTAIFAACSRKYSLTRTGEFKRYRRANIESSLSVDVIDAFLSQAQSNIDQYRNLPQPLAQVDVGLKNVCEESCDTFHSDIVITSPPYGDSNTTVAYGQYSSFGLSWIQGLPNIAQTSYKVDAESLGRRKSRYGDTVKLKIVEDTIDKVSKSNESRARDVSAFFIEYSRAIANIVRDLSTQSVICFVVGNRTVAGQVIPLDKITEAMFKEQDLSLEGTYIRQISNKVMPLKNSPQNKQGKIGSTMTKEYIVVAYKN